MMLPAWPGVGQPKGSTPPTDDMLVIRFSASNGTKCRLPDREARVRPAVQDAITKAI